MKVKFAVMSGTIRLRSWVRWRNGEGIGMYSSSWEDEENVYTVVSASGIKLYYGE